MTSTMNPIITIRRVIMEDAPVLAELSNKTFYDTFTGTCSEDDMQEFLQNYFSLQQVESELADEKDYYYFASIDGKPVAYLRLMEDYRNFPVMKQWRAFELKRLYVLKEYHGKGIAQQLMDFAIEQAQENNYEVLWLGVWEHNLRAQKFYFKYGFEKSGHTHYFPIGNTPQTDLWLWKFFKPQEMFHSK